MKVEYITLGKSLPTNRDSGDDLHNDMLIRLLDCATIEYMHRHVTKQYFESIANNRTVEIPVFDSVRGAFSEGGPAFPGAKIARKSHIQICIRNLNCIKGFFIPREEVEFPVALSS